MEVAMENETPEKLPSYYDKDAFWETDPEYRDFAAMLEELNAETERGVALVVTAFIDDLLGRALASFLIKNESAERLLRGFNAPLGTFATKIAACHAMGLITDEETRQCNFVRKVRNKFAHKVQASFDDDKIRDLCLNLATDERLKETTTTARARFTRASIVLVVALVNRPHLVGERRPKFGEWKF
jgi:hypothetical protein